LALGEKRGRKQKTDKTQMRHTLQIESENRRLREKLRKAELVIDIQKKVSELLGIPLRSPENEENV
jgi:transposase